MSDFQSNSLVGKPFLRVLVCGGRYFSDVEFLYDCLDIVHFRRGILCVIHGACHLGGADKLAGQWAKDNGVAVEEYPVELLKDGPWPAAGSKRNTRMLRLSNPNCGIAFQGGHGTADMVEKMRAKNLKVWCPVKNT